MNQTPSGVTLEKIMSLCKRRGFVFQSADIYGGLNGVYDFGHLGVLMKQNLRNLWLASINKAQSPIFLLEGSLLGPHAVWEASGHVEGFHDPLVDCRSCKHRYRADDIDLEKGCPHCGKKDWSDVRQFNMMFKTQLGALAQSSSEAYLRPETAQSIFINFKNIYSTSRAKLPFGAACIGKSFRNEITPKQFLFRMREFEQMEIEWFCSQKDALGAFDFWTQARQNFYLNIGIHPEKIRLRAHEKTELSHYSQCTSDVEYLFPFGWKEIEGIAYRGDFDLRQHTLHSGKELAVHDEEHGTQEIPHVVECSVGTDRLFLTVLFDAYKEELVEGEIRTVLALDARIAPITAAILPLSKKLAEPAYAMFRDLTCQGLRVAYDESGSIGKRYRRFDEIGTPVCITFDFDSANDGSVTIRNRDTMEQTRIAQGNVAAYLHNVLKNN